MMDILMVGTLIICFGVVLLFAEWCESQVEPDKKKKK